jgi:hypothetical protein
MASGLAAAFRTGQRIGEDLGRGLLDNDWRAFGNDIGRLLGDSISASIPESAGLAGGIAGGLASFGISSLVSGLFSKKKQAPMGTKADPIHTFMINAQDIATAFLVATQNAQLRGAGAGLTQLEGQRLAQAAVGLT